MSATALIRSRWASNVASSALALDQWLQLSRRINALFAEDRGLAGVVVTSGTDTLEETAFFRVVAPWKRTGLPALHEVLRWLSETLYEQEDW